MTIIPWRERPTAKGCNRVAMSHGTPLPFANDVRHKDGTALAGQTPCHAAIPISLLAASGMTATEQHKRQGAR